MILPKVVRSAGPRTFAIGRRSKPKPVITSSNEHCPAGSAAARNPAEPGALHQPHIAAIGSTIRR
jgi:hypothetical protein